MCCTPLNIIFLLYQGVLLLQALTRSNGAIQKIVAFENAFERLLDIITEEGNSDGGIVWRDSFLLTELLASRETHGTRNGNSYIILFLSLWRLEYGFLFPYHVSYLLGFCDLVWCLSSFLKSLNYIFSKPVVLHFLFH